MSIFHGHGFNRELGGLSAVYMGFSAYSGGLDTVAGVRRRRYKEKDGNLHDTEIARNTDGWSSFNADGGIWHRTGILTCQGRMRLSVFGLHSERRAAANVEAVFTWSLVGKLT